MLSSSEILARLRLIRSENVGPITYRHLMRRFGSGAAAIEALPDIAARGNRKNLRVCSLSDAKNELERIEAAQAKLLFIDTALYPPLLAATEDAPPALILRGHMTLFDKPSVAMVGARNCSAAGIRFARGIASDLAARGWCVVSGLARGIDTAAHEGALSQQSGGTIACVAGGIDITYPPENAALYERIANMGILLSEQPLGTVPQGRHFPRRNRIISGFSSGVVVVEAAPKSGSLITARLANEQGREVMAVPGSPADPRAQGCNLLIREGATLVQSADDIIEVLRPISQNIMSDPMSSYTENSQNIPDPTEQERHDIINFLSNAPTPIDEIIRLTGSAPAVIQMILLELELGGQLTRHAGGRVSLS
jgi:DNA processing protein